MNKYESFEYTPQTLAEHLTSQSHMTLYWLNRNGYLNNETATDLLSRMLCIPIRNKPSIGHRILNRFFKKDEADTSYKFPIVLLEDNGIHNSSDTNSKPTLTVVK